MSKPLSELKKRMDPEVLAAARARTVELVAEMSLAETRKSRGISQSLLAAIMGKAQSNISQIESQPDAMVGTLSGYIEALGGTLELHAKFPDGQDVHIKQFRPA